MVRDAELARIPDKKMLILGTGAQGENNAFLVRVVTGEHKSIFLKKGDTVIFSSSVIPGNERSIQNLKDMAEYWLSPLRMNMHKLANRLHIQIV